MDERDYKAMNKDKQSTPSKAMTKLEQHRLTWKGKSDEWLFERLARELTDKVETIHNLNEQNKELIEENEEYKKIFLSQEKYNLQLLAKYNDLQSQLSEAKKALGNIVDPSIKHVDICKSMARTALHNLTTNT